MFGVAYAVVEIVYRPSLLIIMPAASSKYFLEPLDRRVRCCFYVSTAARGRPWKISSSSPQLPSRRKKLGTMFASRVIMTS